MAEPEFKAQATATQPTPADVPRGELGPLNEAVAPAPERPAPEPTPPEDFEEEVVLPDTDDFDDDAVPADEDETLLFGPTDMPEQPMTQGVPVGPGAPSVLIDQSPDDFLNAFAARLRSRRDLPDEVRAWADRRAAGG